MDICETCGHRYGEGSEIVVHPSVAGQRVALAQIDAKLLQFKAHIATLEAKRRVVAENLALVVYPVLTLPAEITSHIFVECLPPHGRVRPSLRQAPLSISQVCRHWREVALSIGKLWSSLDMLFGVKQGNQGTYLVKTWLSRSSGRTLSWTIRRSRRWSRLKTPDIPPFSPNDLARLWRLETREHFQKLRPLHTPLPRLRSLTADLALEDLRDVMQCAPELRELYIVTLAPGANLASQTLVRLEIVKFVPLDMFLSILNSCPLLLHLKCNSIASTNVPDLTPATFPNLRSLAIGASFDALQLVTLPNLVSLEAWNFLDPNVLPPFLSRSSCAIQELHFGGARGAHYLETQLKLIPSVQRLAVSDTDTLDWLLHCLDPDVMFLLPHLQDITVWIRNLTESVDFWKIIKLLCRRRNAVNITQLQSVLVRAKDISSVISPPWWDIPDIVATEIRRVNACGFKFAIWVEFDDLDKDFIFPDGSADACEEFEL